MWQSIKDAALNTIGKTTGKYPDDAWKKKMLLAEHSPIRRLKLYWRWVDLKYWVSVHLVRHKFGIEHWVSTQRTDRTSVDRENLPQSSLVKHACECNAQSVINVSRKRLCNNASPDTRDAWQKVLAEIKKHDEVLYSVCVPECIYRGFCPEMISCGYCNTEAYQKRLQEYRNVNGA